MDLFFPFPRAVPGFGDRQAEHSEAQIINVMDLQRKERFEGLKFTAKPGPEMTLFLLLWIFFVLCRKMQLVSLTSGNRGFVINVQS